MMRKLWTLVTFSVMWTACASPIHHVSPEVRSAVFRSTVSTEFVKVRTPNGPLCVQRTEFPQWMYERLYTWWTWSNIEMVHDPAIGPKNTSLHLKRQRELEILDVPPESDTIGPLLPMTYVNITMAVILANVASGYSGFDEAYEFEGWGVGPGVCEFAHFKFRRTGLRGYRLPTLEEWRAIAPSDWHERSDEFKCRHGNLDDRLRCWDGHAFLAPVASYAPTHDGLFDIWGNVSEWAEPEETEADTDGWWSGPSYKVVGMNYNSLPTWAAWSWGNASFHPLGPDSERAIYGDGVRLVIEPDVHGRCPNLEMLWGRSGDSVKPEEAK